jgi:hypothetical protein
MKTIAAILGTAILLALTEGCAGPAVYGGGYGVYGEYPATTEQYYVAPTYTYSYPYSYPYRYGYRHQWAPYDRDHYLDRGYHWNRHGYYHRDRDDSHR